MVGDLVLLPLATVLMASFYRSASIEMPRESGVGITIASALIAAVSAGATAAFSIFLSETYHGIWSVPHTLFIGLFAYVSCPSFHVPSTKSPSASRQGRPTSLPRSYSYRWPTSCSSPTSAAPSRRGGSRTALPLPATPQREAIPRAYPLTKAGDVRIPSIPLSHFNRRQCHDSSSRI